MSDFELPIGAEIIERDTTPTTDQEKHNLARLLALKGASQYLIDAALEEKAQDFAERTGFPGIYEGI